MTTLQQVFSRFTQDEFPPKFVFCATPTGELRTIMLDEISTLDEKYSLKGMSYDSVAHKHLSMAGDLPILELTSNPNANI